MRHTLFSAGFALLGVAFAAAFVLFIVMRFQRIDASDPRSIPPAYDKPMLFVASIAAVGVACLIIGLQYPA